MIGQIEYADKSEEWPMSLREGFLLFEQLGLRHGFSIVCAVGVSKERQRASIIFSSHSSQDPHLANMADDIAEMFKTFAAAIRSGMQAKGGQS